MITNQLIEDYLYAENYLDRNISSGVINDENY